MYSAYQRPVSSDPTVHFLEGLAQNQGSATVDLVLPLRNPLWFVRAISIIATENLAYEIQLFTRAQNMGATIPTDHFCGVWQFGVLYAGPPAAPGYPFDPADVTPSNAFYHQYVDGNMIPYWDLDQLLAPNPVANVPLGQGVANATPNNAKLHVRLINRSSTPKSAGAGGALQVTFYMATQGAQV